MTTQAPVWSIWGKMLDEGPMWMTFSAAPLSFQVPDLGGTETFADSYGLKEHPEEVGLVSQRVELGLQFHLVHVG